MLLFQRGNGYYGYNNINFINIIFAIIKGNRANAIIAILALFSFNNFLEKINETTYKKITNKYIKINSNINIALSKKLSLMKNKLTNKEQSIENIPNNNQKNNTKYMIIM